MLKVAILRFLLFWGVWLLVPMAVDGITAVGYLWAAFRRSRERQVSDSSGKPSKLRLVTVLVPVHNAEKTLYTCLASLAAQDYPVDLMEVICVGNAVSDRSRIEYFRATRDFPRLRASWVELGSKGKSKALNAGIHLSGGDIIFNVDADTRLAPNAISLMVRAFESNRLLGAACGSIQVDEVESGDVWWRRLFNQCEIVEYLQAFRVGRRYQTMRDSVFTLSGAFVAFRRDVLVGTHLYDEVTVSEDTKLTFDIRMMHSDRWKIQCVDEAQAFVEPIHSFSKFMSQRLRWQRGEIEVLSLHPQLYLRNPVSALSTFVGRTLIVDHTLAFPRLVWVFILPFLYILGYSLPLVVTAMWLTYFMYVLLELVFMLSVRSVLRAAYGRKAIEWWYLPLLMPGYRFITYWFRLAGMIYALTESAEWNTMTEAERIRNTAKEMWSRLRFRFRKKRAALRDGGVGV